MYSNCRTVSLSPLWPLPVVWADCWFVPRLTATFAVWLV
jgi:hypothetical protein